jgi:hypothetical protein
MLTWIIQITIISIILIFLVHYLINFFKSTLTVPKIKDLVNAPTQKYENIYNTIKSNKTSSNNSNANSSYTLVDLLPAKEETSTMKNELKNFLKKQLQEPTSRSPIETISSDASYAIY